jgi:hypothetical protein
VENRQKWVWINKYGIEVATQSNARQAYKMAILAILSLARLPFRHAREWAEHALAPAKAQVCVWCLVWKADCFRLQSPFCVQPAAKSRRLTIH